jgi:hypothetical protein
VAAKYGGSPRHRPSALRVRRQRKNLQRGENTIAANTFASEYGNMSAKNKPTGETNKTLLSY